MCNVDQIKKCLETSKSRRNSIITEDMKVKIHEGVSKGNRFDDILRSCQIDNQYVKGYHLKGYLQRYLRRLERESK